MQQARGIANAKSQATAKQGKTQYDKKAKSRILNQGDRVLVRNFEKGGSGKIRAFWEDRIYTMLKRMNEDGPVYVVQPENGQGRQRTPHRTLLYHCNDLPIDESVEFEQRKKNTKQNRVKNVANRSKRSHETRGTDDDEDEINVGFYPNELQPNAVHDDPEMRAPMNEQEPNPEQEHDIAGDNVQEAINEPEAEPDQDEQENVIAVDNAQDQDLLPPRYNAPETEPVEDIHDDIALSPDVEQAPRPQRT